MKSSAIVDGVRYGSVAACVLLLAACGGGGGDDSAPGVSSDPVAVSASNYESVAREGAEAASSTNNTKSWTALAGVIAAPGPDWVQFGLAQLKQLRTLPGSGSTLAGVTASRTVSCGVSGSYKATLVDQNGNNNLDAGDSAKLEFSACVGSDGSVINGALTLAFNANQVGDPATDSAYQLDVTMTFGDISVLDAGVTSGVDGSLRLVTSRSAVNVGSDEIRCPSLAVYQTVSGQTQRASMVNFLGVQTYSASELAGVYSADRISLDSQGGRYVALSTPSPVRQRHTDSYPYAGTMKFVGSGGGTALVQVLDTTQVQIAYDATGDGVYENSVTRSWSTIDW